MPEVVKLLFRLKQNKRLLHRCNATTEGVESYVSPTSQPGWVPLK